MPGTNFHLAPPVRTVDGLTAVPIDIQQLDALVVFDAATRRAQADATLQFIMGGTTGRPVFDLRQTIQQAFLNGAALSPSALGHHQFGSDPDAKLRIVDWVLPANSTNTLRLVYEMAQPQSLGSQPIGWDASSSRVYWDLWFTDLKPARYLEMWFPSNLIYDQFPFHVEIQLLNSAFAHLLITNGAVTDLAANQWRVDFPDRFTSLSSMLILAASDRISARHGTMVLPGSGATLHLDTYKLTTTVADLAAVENNLRTYIAGNVTHIGPYIHGDRFTTFVWPGPRSMEYEGAVTTDPNALEHETFHSWFARGVKPATQNDSWFDEGWTSYNTDPNRFTVQPFNLTAPPVTLCGSDSFNRITPATSYTEGFRFFSGLAASLGLANLLAYMSDFYREDPMQLLTTGELEAYLIARSGAVEIANYFERFVYGFGTAPPGADLYIRDADGDPGVDLYAGPEFWNSSDLWIRLQDDGGASHQNPEYGQDNWFYASVHNRGTQTARTFVVTFNVKPWAGTQFTYPTDFLPCITATVGFNLAPGASTVVKAKWPAALVPPAGTHACWLASVYTPVDVAPAGRHVWESNNLAQKNLVIVDLLPDTSVVIPFQLGSLFQVQQEIHRVEIRRPQQWMRLAVALVHSDPGVIDELYRSAVQPGGNSGPMVRELRLAQPARVEIGTRATELKPLGLTLGMGSQVALDPPAQGASPLRQVRLIEDSPGRVSISFDPGLLCGFPVLLRPRIPLSLGLRIAVPQDARPGDVIELHLIERNSAAHVVGGITVQLNVRASA